MLLSVFFMSDVFVVHVIFVLGLLMVFCFQAEDGIRDLVRSRGLGDVYKRQVHPSARWLRPRASYFPRPHWPPANTG